MYCGHIKVHIISSKCVNRPAYPGKADQLLHDEKKRLLNCNKTIYMLVVCVCGEGALVAQWLEHQSCTS